jgi:hypothetical protein
MKKKKFTFGVARHQVCDIEVEAETFEEAEEIAEEKVEDLDIHFWISVNSEVELLELID